MAGAGDEEDEEEDPFGRLPGVPSSALDPWEGSVVGTSSVKLGL
jgi:hypothetical protein